MKNITDKITGFFSSFIASLKTDKKKLILVIAVVVILLILLIGGRNKKPEVVPGFGTQLTNVLNNDNYSGSGTMSICNNEFDIVINKNANNKQFGLKNNNVNYTGLITEYNKAIYLNSSVFKSKGDIISIRKTTPAATEGEEAPAEIRIKDVLLDILNSEFLTYTEAENLYTATITNGENWSKFFNEAETKLSEKKEDILKSYTDVGPAREELNNICTALKNIGASSNDANSITLVLSYNPEASSYKLSMDISLDFNALPEFIQEKDFDTNKFTVYSTINYAFTENIVNIPSGSVRGIENNSINSFISDCWNSLFERKTYTTKSVVTEKADSVQNIITLGNTTETYQYIFDKDGIYQGTLLVSSKDKNVIKQYIEKYSTDRENQAIYNANTKEFSVSFDISETGLSSLNKIATTPRGLAAYLKTAEGVVPIV